MADYKLNFTGEEIDQKLAKIEELASKDEIPTTTSQLTNNSGFVTENNVRQIINSSGFITIEL